MDSKEARALLADAELVHSVATIQAALEDVAARIHRQLAERNPLVLCVMTELAWSLKNCVWSGG